MLKAFRNTLFQTAAFIVVIVLAMFMLQLFGIDTAKPSYRFWAELLVMSFAFVSLRTNLSKRHHDAQR